MLMWHYVRVLTYSTKALHVRYGQNHKPKKNPMTGINVDTQNAISKRNRLPLVSM